MHEKMAGNDQKPTPSLRIISRSTVRQSPCQEGCSSIMHLTPWDLQLLSIDYIQKGILLPKPPTPLHLLHRIGHEPIDQHPLLSRLVSSLSQTLGHFYPLAGRLSTIGHDDDASMSVLIDCNNAGAELVVAAASGITTYDIVASLYVPDVVRSFFPLNGAISLDGRSVPLLGIQLTELSDGGVFMGCSANHAVVDGTSFWNFLNSWSEISRSAGTISCPPVLHRWFLPDYINPPVRLPFADPEEFTRRLAPPPGLKECFFHFSARSVKDLKGRANSEMNITHISSLQALLAHLWMSVVRARKLDAGQESTYLLAGGQRSKTDPPLPAAYFGNSVMIIRAKAFAGDIMSRGLGWVAWQLNRAVAAHAATSVQHTLELWCKEPAFVSFGGLSPRDLVTGSSPRFNVYGNDFGWGKPVAVRSGGGSKIDGTATVYPGPEEGSMALEVCLSAAAMISLVDDPEFMEAVCHVSS